MKLKNVIACLAVLAFVSGSTCAMAKNVDNQQKVEKQGKIKKSEVKYKKGEGWKKNFEGQKKVEDMSIWDY